MVDEDRAVDDVGGDVSVPNNCTPTRKPDQSSSSGSARPVLQSTSTWPCTTMLLFVPLLVPPIKFLLFPKPCFSDRSECQKSNCRSVAGILRRIPIMPNPPCIPLRLIFRKCCKADSEDGLILWLLHCCFFFQKYTQGKTIWFVASWLASQVS
jgi:hypothetical protein